MNKKTYRESQKLFPLSFLSVSQLSLGLGIKFYIFFLNADSMGRSKLLKIIFLGAKFIEIFAILYKQLETNFKDNRDYY